MVDFCGRSTHSAKYRFCGALAVYTERFQVKTERTSFENGWERRTHCQLVAWHGSAAFQRSYEGSGQKGCLSARCWKRTLTGLCTWRQHKNPSFIPWTPPIRSQETILCQLEVNLSKSISFNITTGLFSQQPPAGIYNWPLFVLKKSFRWKQFENERCSHEKL